MCNYIKGLQKSREILLLLPYPETQVTLMQMATRLVWHNFPLVKPSWLTFITPLSTICLGIAFQEDVFHDLTGFRMFLRTSILPLLKMNAMFLFFSQRALHLAAKTAQICLRMARQLHQPFPSRTWSASYWSLKSSVCLSSSIDLIMMERN